jgi:hypothetical protein
VWMRRSSICDFFYLSLCYLITALWTSYNLCYVFIRTQFLVPNKMYLCYWLILVGYLELSQWQECGCVNQAVVVHSAFVLNIIILTGLWARYEVQLGTYKAISHPRLILSLMETQIHGFYKLFPHLTTTTSCILTKSQNFISAKRRSATSSKTQISALKHSQHTQTHLLHQGMIDWLSMEIRLSKATCVAKFGMNPARAKVDFNRI